MNEDAVPDLTQAFRRISANLKAMTVLGDVLRGDIPATQTHLAGLPVESVQELSAAAAMLTSLSDEELMRRG